MAGGRVTDGRGGILTAAPLGPSRQQQLLAGRLVRLWGSVTRSVAIMGAKKKNQGCENVGVEGSMRKLTRARR